MNLFLVEDKNLFISYCQCHGCRWPGSTRSQVICSHGIDSVLREYSGLRTRRIYAFTLEIIVTVHLQWFIQYYWLLQLGRIKSLFSSLQNHGWSSTQPNRIAHILTAHRRAAHNPAARLCAGSVVCNLSRQQCRLAQRWSNVGTIVPTLGQRWSNLDCCLTG